MYLIHGTMPRDTRDTWMWPRSDRAMAFARRRLRLDTAPAGHNYAADVSQVMRAGFSEALSRGVLGLRDRAGASRGLMDNPLALLYPALRVQDTFNKASFIEAASFT